MAWRKLSQIFTLRNVAFPSLVLRLPSESYLSPQRKVWICIKLSALENKRSGTEILGDSPCSMYHHQGKEEVPLEKEAGALRAQEAYGVGYTCLPINPGYF